MNNMIPDSYADANGFYGRFGGSYVTPDMQERLNLVRAEFERAVDDPEFIAEFHRILRDYVGRPTPLYRAPALSRRYGAEVYLKREDLNHTGAHKINNAIGSVLLAKRMGKTRVVAETGAGQHGVATATACALLGLDCTVYMGAADVERQLPNVQRMQMLNARVVAVDAGSQTLTEAVDAAIADWAAHPDDTFYVIGSTVGPHPYPDMVSRFQSIISDEIRKQLLEHTGRETPDYVVACVGGGSNASGAFYHFINSPEVRLVAAEGGGKGAMSGRTAATMTIGTEGVIHGFNTLVMKTPEGGICEPYSISAGLDYPGVGPLLAHLHHTGRVSAVAITDDEAMEAAYLLSRSEGIIPALESAHALAALEHLDLRHGDVVVVNLSGRGDKDMAAYLSR